MDITKDIQPMTTFRNHSAAIMQHLKDSGLKPIRPRGRAGGSMDSSS